MRLHTFWLRLISALENWFKYEFLKSMQNIFNKKSLVVKDPTIKIGASIQVSFSAGISQTPRTLGSLREIGRLILLSPWPWQTPCKANDTPVGQEMLATPNVCHLVFFFNGRFIWRKNHGSLVPPFYWSCILKPTRIKREYEKTIDKHILVQQQKIPQQGRCTKYPHKKKRLNVHSDSSFACKETSNQHFRRHAHPEWWFPSPSLFFPHFVVFVNKGYKNPQVWKQTQLKWRVFLNSTNNCIR